MRRSRVVKGGDGLLPWDDGHARISCERRRLGEIVLERAFRLVRAEYWW